MIFFQKILRTSSISDRPLFLACLALACFLWLFNALSKKYNLVVPVQVLYNNLPGNQIPTTPIENNLELNLYGEGFDLLRYGVSKSLQPIYIDFGNLDGQKAIPTSSFLPQLENQFRKLEILEIYPKVIPVQLEEASSKMVPVKLNTNIGFAPSYFQLDSIKLNPSKILVSGPKSVVDSINVWPSQQLSLENIQNSQTGSILLEKPNSFNLTIEPELLGYEIMVDQWTEKSFELNITTVNLKDSLQVFLYPQKAQLSIQIPLSEYEAFTDAFFELKADFTNIDLKSKSKVPVEMVSKHPKNIRNPQIKPEKVEFLIYK